MPAARIDHAHAVLLPSDADAGVWEYFATATIPVPEQVRARARRARPAQRGEPLSVAASRRRPGVRRGRVELMLKQLAVDGVVDRVEGGWVGDGRAEWTYDREHYDGVVAVRRREADIMRAYVRGERCLMELLQESLDDPAAEPCGRCSVCRGGLPEALRGRPSRRRCATVTALLRGAGAPARAAQDVARRGVRSRGRIAAEGGAEQGRTLVFADAPEWRETVRGAFARDGAAPDELEGGCVRLLGQWRASGRPARGRGDLTASGSPRSPATWPTTSPRSGGWTRPTLAVDPSRRRRGVRELSSADEAAAWLARWPRRRGRARRWPAGRCCSWWTPRLAVAGDGRPPRCCAGPARPPCCRCCCTGGRDRDFQPLRLLWPCGRSGPCGRYGPVVALAPAIATAPWSRRPPWVLRACGRSGPEVGPGTAAAGRLRPPPPRRHPPDPRRGRRTAPHLTRGGRRVTVCAPARDGRPCRQYRGWSARSRKSRTEAGIGTVEREVRSM